MDLREADHECEPAYGMEGLGCDGAANIGDGPLIHMLVQPPASVELSTVGKAVLG